MNVSHYLQLFNQAVKGRNRERIAALLSNGLVKPRSVPPVDFSTISSVIGQVADLPVNSNKEWNEILDKLLRFVQQSMLLHAGWNKVVATNLLAWEALERGDYLSSFRRSHECLSALLQQADNEECPNAWTVPALHRVTLDALALHPKAKVHSDNTGQLEVYEMCMNELANTVRSAFTFCNRDKTPSSPEDIEIKNRKYGALVLANACFRIYFALGTISKPCSALIDALEQSYGTENPLEPRRITVQDSIYSVSALVTYQYYTGTLHMLRDEFVQANARLTFALKHCRNDRQSESQRRNILRVLIPVRLNLGIVPTLNLLKKYDWVEKYSGIVEGVKTGNFPVFRACLERNQEIFMKEMTYMSLDRLQLLVMRSFIRRL